MMTNCCGWSVDGKWQWAQASEHPLRRKDETSSSLAGYPKTSMKSNQSTDNNYPKQQQAVPQTSFQGRNVHTTVSTRRRAAGNAHHIGALSMGLTGLVLGGAMNYSSKWWLWQMM